MVGFSRAKSSYSSNDTTINPKTGFRSSVPQFIGIDDTYERPIPIAFDLKPEVSVKSIDYTVDPLADYNSDNNDNNSSSQNAIDNTLNYIDDYNTSIVSEENNPTGGMTQANIDNPVANPTDFYGNPIEKEVYSPTFNPISLVPGFGLIDTLTQPSIPTSGYGTPGTYSGLSGGKFNQSGQAVNPITGQPIAEYSTKGAFIDSLLDDPLSNTTSPQGKLTDIEYAGQTSELASLSAGTTDPTGNPATTGLDDAAADKVATQLGLDMGFPAHTVAPGTPTHTSLKTGVYTPGSQFFPGGKITDGTGNS